MGMILAADIGGTNSRFARFTVTDGKHLEMKDSVWLETGAVESFAELVDNFWKSGLSEGPGDFDAAVVAVPGPVKEGTLCDAMPNVRWDVDLSVVDFGVPCTSLVNDFTAQAYACRTVAVRDAAVIQEGVRQRRGVIGVLGAGTGLGHSALIPCGRGWTALASEGGHMASAFVGVREAEYAEFNRLRTGRPWAEGDSVVTGLGLATLHEFLTGEVLAPREIAAKLTVESETTRWFARFYGRACRNWALGLMAGGGMYLTGGVAAKNPMFVTAPEFLHEFHDCPIHEGFLRQVPVKLNTNEESGLYGAAFLGVQLLR